ncbi:MAG: alpha/beta fold hydrolase [Chloroflexota bacterium]
MNIPQVETTFQKVITSDGVALHIEVGGRGTPCLYVHGGPGSGSYWARKFAGDIFERHFQMIYLDQRSCCRSTSPQDGNYTLERMVADFETARQALGIERWLTMGHSFAGLLMMGYIQRFPQVIQGMLFINAALNMNETFHLASLNLSRWAKHNSPLDGGVAAFTGYQPLLSNARFDLIVLIVLGMAMCTSGGIGRVAALNAWRHPLAIVGYILGAAILLVAGAVFLSVKLPFIANEQQALLLVAGLIGAKVINSVIHSLLTRG